MDAQDVALLTVGGCVTLVSVLQLARSAWSSRAALLRAARKAGACRRRRDTGDAVGRAVAAKLREQLLAEFRIGLKGGWLMMLALAARVLHSRISLPHEPFLSAGGDFVVVGALALVTVPQLLPGALRHETVDLFYLSLMALLTVYVAPTVWSEEQHVLGTLVVVMLETLLSSLRLDLSRIVVCNIALCVSACSSIAFVFEMDTDTKIALSLAWLAACLMITASSLLRGRSVSAGMRAAVEAQAAQKVLSAIRAVLCTFCDVVVQLDSDCTIVSNGADLACFLLRGCSLTGHRFDELISHPDDRALFLSRLRASSPASGAAAAASADALHVATGDGDFTPSGTAGTDAASSDALHGDDGASAPGGADVTDAASPGGMAALADTLYLPTCDGEGRDLCLEVSWFGYAGVDGRTQYMVGMREHRRARGDGKRAPLPPQQRNMESTEAPPPVAGAAAHADPRLSPDSMGEASAIVVIDCDRKGFPVVDYTPGLTLHLGRVERQVPIVDYVEKDKEKFVRWVRTGLKQAKAAGSEAGGAPSPPKSFAATFRTRRRRRKADCIFLPVACTQTDAQTGEDPLLARIVLTRIERCRSPHPSLPSGSSRDSDSGGSGSESASSSRSRSSGRSGRLAAVVQAKAAPAAAAQGRVIGKPTSL